MGLFGRKNSSQSPANTVKLLFTSDIHGSDVVFKKFLNAGKMYKVDALIIGGDLAGKALYPIVDLGEGKFEVDSRVVGREGLQQVIAEIRNSGNYYVITDKKGLEAMKEDKRQLDEAFKNAISEVLRNWIKIAEEKLSDFNVPLYYNLGNDDPEYMFDVLSESDRFVKTEGNVIQIGKYEMVSYGYVNPTPWHTPREMEEDKLYVKLKEEANKVKDPEMAIFNFHAPPYNTNIDNAPLLDKDLKPVVRGGEIVMTHVGSTSVRRVEEEFQPLLGLHGHIHESRGFDKVGKTLVINPGSEYGEGILHAVYVVLEGKKVKAHQFIIG